MDIKIKIHDRVWADFVLLVEDTHAAISPSHRLNELLKSSLLNHKVTKLRKKRYNERCHIIERSPEMLDRLYREDREDEEQVAQWEREYDE